MGQLRNLVGNRMLVAPGARGIIQDGPDTILLVRRRDNGLWVMPAGGLEPGESIEDCLKRESREETGLELISASPIAIYSEPRFESTNSYGAENKMLAIVFLVHEWSGDLIRETDETIDARFFSLSDLPEIPELYHETIDDLKAYLATGTVIVK